MKKYIFALALLAITLLVSCSDSSDFTTKVLTRPDIPGIPGFSWFELKVNVYKPDLTLISDIKTLVKPKHSFYFFAAPSCGCDSTQDAFPEGVKVLQDLGVDMNTNCKFIVMKNETAENPFKDNFKVEKLPEIYLVVDGLPVYSIAKTLRGMPKNTPIESVILEAIKANL